MWFLYVVCLLCLLTALFNFAILVAIALIMVRTTPTAPRVPAQESNLIDPVPQMPYNLENLFPKSGE